MGPLYSYVSEEPDDDEDEYDDSEVAKPKALAKNVAHRAVSNRSRAAPTLSRGMAIAKKRTAPARKVGSALQESIAEYLRHDGDVLQPRTRNTRSSYRSSTQGQSATSAPGSAPAIKLKIGKDRLREATSTWTPPPGAAADSATGASTAATPESTTSRGAARGRKVVEESDEEDDSAEGVEDDEMDVDAEGVEDDELIDEDAEGETDDEMLSDDTSRTGTPDMSRLTSRQRTKLGDITTDHLMELPSGYSEPSPSLAPNIY